MDDAERTKLMRDGIDFYQSLCRAIVMAGGSSPPFEFLQKLTMDELMSKYSCNDIRFCYCPPVKVEKEGNVTRAMFDKPVEVHDGDTMQVNYSLDAHGDVEIKGVFVNPAPSCAKDLDPSGCGRPGCDQCSKPVHVDNRQWGVKGDAHALAQFVQDTLLIQLNVLQGETLSYKTCFEQSLESDVIDAFDKFFDSFVKLRNAVGDWAQRNAVDLTRCPPQSKRYLVEHCYEDMDWQPLGEFQDGREAIQYSVDQCRNAIAVGMTRVIDRKYQKVIITNPAGGYR